MEWQPIETAPKSGYIVVGTQYAKGKWLVNYVFWDDLVEEWTDASSDRYIRPQVWAPQPPEQPDEAIAKAAKLFV